MPPPFGEPAPGPFCGSSIPSGPRLLAEGIGMNRPFFRILMASSIRFDDRREIEAHGGDRRLGVDDAALIKLEQQGHELLGVMEVHLVERDRDLEADPQGLLEQFDFAFEPFQEGVLGLADFLHQTLEVQDAVAHGRSSCRPCR